MCNSKNTKYTIGVDFGTLSARAVLVDVKDGRAICDSVFEYTHGVMDKVLAKTNEPLPHSFALQDAADYIEAFRNTVVDILCRSDVCTDDIIGVSVDFTSCTLLPVNKDAVPLSFDEKYSSNPHAYVKLWKHHAAQPYADRFNEIASVHAPEILARFGGKMSPEWLFPKVMEVLDKAPEIYDAADYFIEGGDFITWLLTGKQTRGYTFAAYKSAFHHELGYPKKDFLSLLDERLTDIAETKLNAPMVFTGESAGEVSPLSRERFGVSPDSPWLPSGIAVACPQPDGHTVAAALNASHDGDMFFILGTSACFMLISNEYKLIPGICGVAKDGLYPGFAAYESGLCCFGDHFDWAVKNICPAKYSEEARSLSLSDIAYISKKAESVAPGANGVIALNWFNGNRNPLADYFLSGAFIGMTLATKPEDLFRALVEANAFGTRLIIENFEKHGIPVGNITAAGGITFKSPFIMQVLADVLGKEIRTSSQLHSSSLAGAIYAAVAAGEKAGGYDKLCDACAAMSDPCPTVYKPDPKAHEIYNKLYDEYCGLVDYFGKGDNEIMRRLRRIGELSKEQHDFERNS